MFIIDFLVILDNIIWFLFVEKLGEGLIFMLFGVNFLWVVVFKIFIEVWLLFEIVGIGIEIVCLFVLKVCKFVKLFRLVIFDNLL